MSDLTTGRTEPCKDNTGGIRRMYVMSFVKYNRSLIAGFGTHTITSFPTTLMFELEGRNKKADESYNNGLYEQSLTINLAKQDTETLVLLSKINNGITRVITTDHKGINKIYGLENGLDCDYSIKSGNGKSDFNGYEVELKGREEYKAHFVGNFGSTGFFTEGLTYGCLLSSSGRPSSIADLVSSCNALQS